MKKAIQKKYVKVNNIIAETATLLQGGETISLYGLEGTKPVFEKKIDVIFEDEHIAIVYKPAGILVSGNKFQTLENTLPYNLNKSSEPDALVQTLPVHRLDYPTTGLLLIGKTAKAVILLKKMFENKLIDKTYTAVTYGEMPIKGVIYDSIDEKDATSAYKVLETLKSERYNFLNLVELYPKTGRRHQLRKHLASIGTPIFGDLDYGIEGLISKGNGLYLHASNLKFKHPITCEKLDITAPLPKKFKRLFSTF
ncbi:MULTISPECIES: RluA family pseudouridine synthase [Cellulophaga]|uniref:RluA family pseudouridine synthase n=1 Tax=Cellulophaga TaxID=104264 RepID=UPI002091B02E|nr:MULTISPECIES: RluA family pseudouridine synthase [Cellulophaga]MDO6768992.1 RluA family pseudouridine synthase [Cellulophaga sp. 1_MG-2023]